ncbi:MAG: MFS transporter [Candidatus Cloacimonadota bacterium]|nr:MFS transporter [Candidatus Cloacimonadota bacterium]
MKLDKSILGWISYDFANSSFTTVIVTVVYSVYFKNIVVGGKLSGDSLWGLSVSVSMLIVAFIAPILGAISDYSKSKKKFLFFFCYLSVLFTALLYFVRQGDIFWGMLLFILANIGFEGGNVFYNAFLPEIAKKENIGKISGFGWGFGYIGGLTALGISYIIIGRGTVYVFPFIAAFYGIFAIPIFLLIKKKSFRKDFEHENYIKIGYKRLKTTFQNIRNYRELWKFLIAFFFYNDGIKTVIVFAAIYGASQFGMTGTKLIIYFLLANVFAFLGSIFFGFIVDRIGVKSTISISLLIWIVIVVGAFFCTNVNQFYGIGILAGIAMGASQSSSRAMVSLLTPTGKHAEFFGFYALSGKASAIIGPMMYGTIIALLRSQRLAILSIGIFFIFGLILLQTVNEKEGIKIANNK